MQTECNATHWARIQCRFYSVNYEYRTLTFRSSKRKMPIEMSYTVLFTWASRLQRKDKGPKRHFFCIFLSLSRPNWCVSKNNNINQSLLYFSSLIAFIKMPCIWDRSKVFRCGEVSFGYNKKKTLYECFCIEALRKNKKKVSIPFVWTNFIRLLCGTNFKCIKCRQ